jgi:hypothetical protein
MKTKIRISCLSLILLVNLLFSCKKGGIPPVVETSPITNVSTFSANCGGNITSEGSSAVIARGVCWSTNKNPTIDNIKTVDGSGTGSFTSTIAGLYVGVAYFVRAYATNSEGTGYGITRSFIPSGQTPTATIAPANGISSTAATLNGFVNGNSLSTKVIFQYGTSIVYDSTKVAEQSPVTDNIDINVSVNISQLKPATTYYYRIVASNSLGSTFSSYTSFKTTVK